MKSRDFDQVKPYTYWIQNISTGIKYIGLRYQNVRLKKTPLEDFGIHYFTSGKLKKEFKRNPKKFKTKLLFTYDDIAEATAHEFELTRKAKDNNRYANIASYPHFIATEEVRQKISMSKMGNQFAKGRVVSEETRRKLSIANTGKPSPMKGIPRSEETKKKMSKSITGKKVSDDARKKLSKALTGRKIPREVTEKIAKARRGIPRSEEVKLKISLAQKGRKKGPMPEEKKRQISLALKGRKKNPMSGETKRKLSLALKGKKYKKR